MVLFVRENFLIFNRNFLLLKRFCFLFLAMAAKVIRDDGFLALYNGLSASCLRQATYTTTRFAIYGSVRSLRPNSNLSFIEKISLAAGSGAIGAFVGLSNISLKRNNINIVLHCKL